MNGKLARVLVLYSSIYIGIGGFWFLETDDRLNILVLIGIPVLVYLGYIALDVLIRRGLKRGLAGLTLALLVAIPIVPFAVPQTQPLLANWWPDPSNPFFSSNESASATSTPSAAVQPPSARSPSPEIEPTAVPTPPQVQKARITSKSLNIRSAANADANIVGNLADSDIVELTGAEQNGWLEVQFGRLTGWVNGKYVEILE